MSNILGKTIIKIEFECHRKRKTNERDKITKEHDDKVKKILQK